MTSSDPLPDAAGRNRVCGACGHHMTLERCGFASITVNGNTHYLCHADDHSCYMAWQPVADDPLVAAARTVCPYCGMTTWVDGHCVLPGCDGHKEQAEPSETITAYLQRRFSSELDQQPDAADADLEPWADTGQPAEWHKQQPTSPGATDPRVKALGNVTNPVTRETILAAADAAARAAGIVRVDADRLTDALLKASETTDSTMTYPGWVEGYAGTLAERVLAELREANHD